MQDVHKINEKYNPSKKHEILIVLMTWLLIWLKTKNSVVTKLFIRGRKSNISLAFITQSFFKVLEDVRLKSSHFFIMKNLNKRELQQIALNHLSGFYEDLQKMYCGTIFFSVNDAMPASDNLIRLRKFFFNI